MRRLFFVVLMSGWMVPLAAATKTLLIVGDSLSAGYGIAVDAGWAAQLQQRLNTEQRAYRVVNASISGDTTANGLARLPKLLAAHHPQIVIIELGGNDGLRALSLAAMQHNIETMIAKARLAGAHVLLIGIRLPPNYGKIYAEKFHRVYEDIAKTQQIPWVPFLLDGVAAHSALMQPDGLHPNAAGQGKVLDNVWLVLRPVLQ